MATFNDVKSLMEGLSFTDLRKVISYADQLSDAAKKKDFMDVFMGSEKKVYINLGKGLSNDWVAFRIIGIEETGVVVKDWNNDDAKKRLVPFDRARTESDMKLG